MWDNFRACIEKLAISEEELSRVVRLTKQKYRVPKSFGADNTMGPLAGVGQRVKGQQYKAMSSLGMTDPKMGRLANMRQAMSMLPVKKDTANLLAGSKRAIVPGRYGGISRELRGMVEAPRKYSGKQKEMLSKFMWAHEGAEQAAKRYVPGSTGHVNPGVLVKETNMLNTLKSAPGVSDRIRSFLSPIREQETNTRIKYKVNGVPFEWRWGKGATNLETGQVLPRVSRHHRKAINNVAASKSLPILNNPKLSPSKRMAAIGKNLEKSTLSSPPAKMVAKKVAKKGIAGQLVKFLGKLVRKKLHLG